MKKILLLLVFFIFPNGAHAELDIFLSSQNLPYISNTWTSDNTPDSGSSKIRVQNLFHREDFPSDYKHSSATIQDNIRQLFPALADPEKQARYNSLIHFDGSQKLSQYLSIAVSDTTESIITSKKANNFILTPFESVFESCSIDLASRKNIARTLIENIHDGNFSSINNMQYSDIRFGDCIIPYPDSRRGNSEITDSFPSNKIIAQNISGNPISFGSLENDVDLVALKGLDITGSFQEVQDDKLLSIQSARIDADQDFDKSAGRNKILFVHQNHMMNPFGDALIQGNTTIGYTISGVAFNANHPLLIEESDSEEERTILPWEKLQEGIYTKTLIQENSFENIGGVYRPRQSVGVSTYYAISYNYDITPPSCEKTIFSHENSGNQNFILPENKWSHSNKYAYFACGDIESGCACDSVNENCFIKDGNVLSVPQIAAHNGAVSYSFNNLAGLSGVCISDPSEKIFYDFLAPGFDIITSGSIETSLTKEYVNNNGVLFDGKQVIGRKSYQIQEILEFQASGSLDVSLLIFDPYDSAKSGEGVSGLEGYTLEIFKFENDNWVEKTRKVEVYEAYNSNANKNTRDQKTIHFSDLDNIENIAQKSGKYQVSLRLTDAAQNVSSIIWYFDIIPGPIDVSKSIMSTTNKNTLYANNVSAYNYIISLKDSYLNPISEREIGNIDMSCSGISDCNEVRANMVGSTPSGTNALEIDTIQSTSDSNGDLRFSLKSTAPGEFSEGIKVDFINPAESHVFIGTTNSFLAPFDGLLETKVGVDWLDDTLIVDSEAEYRLSIINNASMSATWNLNNFSGNLKARHPDTTFTLSTAPNKSGNAVYFGGTFGSSLSEDESHKTLLEIPNSSNNTVSGVIISYSLGGKNISYRLYKNYQIQEIITLGNTGELENPVKIIGQLQGVGNEHNEKERQNFTDLNSNALRNALRKNIGKHLAGRTQDGDAGGIRFIDKTNSSNKLYKLSGKADFETLIVRNGNIHITGDFTAARSGEKVGIISYNDAGYNKESGYEDTGNIYIEDTVNSIEAFIYADGALISTKGGNPIEESDSSRIDTKNSILPNQLNIRGALFTRNTLAGARELAGEYILPGSENTTNRSLALQYDLYYMRRGNNGCKTDSYGFCDIPHYMIIDYDPEVQSNPPKLFSTN